MQLIAPDILAEARGMTSAMAGTITVLGFALWLFGWRWHRFWVVAGITLAAGLIGMNAGRTTGGTQVMAIGILVAVAAGLLALELAKVLAFVAGGCGAWLAVQWVLPQAQELWAVFLCGGLFGLLLYRLWTMLLTSLMGALLAGHAGILLVEQFWGVNSSDWVAQNVAALNGVVVGFVVLGILLQAVSTRDPEQTTESEKESEENTEDEPVPTPTLTKAATASGWKLLNSRKAT
ncbi:Putative uncharacterized protein OS=uncultured planctomycete GN=HGMM_F22C11C06 PE=4 SV=1 [Gemmata massiliana]|uniref:DUF4203 domain-containing protein n=1 Tax=Gemmata massiliana TaxID=1210884 RepID=A0A6P2D0S3_9BACT|nr:hypothetical protein [Gemmata massiliana]VTR94851.1 Putative uncharacterized protein OS=uncultured planctomycete GN=HGMM_F22C11C06 PE=4 SV=1 [Gemmata massiliana]